MYIPNWPNFGMSLTLTIIYLKLWTRELKSFNDLALVNQILKLEQLCKYIAGTNLRGFLDWVIN